MSRIGKKPITLPAGVKVEAKAGQVQVQGPKGKLSWTAPATITVNCANNQVVIERADDSRQSRELHGMTRAIINNMVIGVEKGYSKRLMIYGTGYSCDLKGRELQMNIGFMGRSVNKGPQFTIPIPAGVEVVVEAKAARGESEPAKLLISGCDKQLVGEFAAEIRSLRKTEPYKGKGVRYEGEHVIRKQGKALASSGS
ncbi:MAG: 50S ribosomal protein L6 [Phycisphaerae bacterium]|nr:50S ribosomal protein L6 [Phycisphaerae bacterium]